MAINGKALGDVDQDGEEIVDENFLLLLNCHHEPIQFFAPKAADVDSWHVLIDTNEPDLADGSRALDSETPYNLMPLSLVLACSGSRQPEAGKGSANS
jgi:hypothetical protein